MFICHIFPCIIEVYTEKGGVNMLGINTYTKQLKKEEKANNTIIRYKSDVKQFQEIMGDGRI